MYSMDNIRLAMLPVRNDEPPGMARFCPGARRSFFCRMKCKTGAPIKEECGVGDMTGGSAGGISCISNATNCTTSSTTTDTSANGAQMSEAASENPPTQSGRPALQKQQQLRDQTSASTSSSIPTTATTTTAPPAAGASLPTAAATVASSSNDRKYNVLQCTGYLKSWAPATIGAEDATDLESDSDICSMSCLVAIGRIPPDIYECSADEQSRPQKRSDAAAVVNVLPIQFMSRHAIDGKFLFVDQR